MSFILLQTGILGLSAGEWIAYVVAALSTGFLFWKEVVQKKLEASVELKALMTTAEIDQKKHKLTTEAQTLEKIMESYTELNRNVFKLFEEYLTNIHKNVAENKVNINFIKNMHDISERTSEEIIQNLNQAIDRLKQIELMLEIRKLDK